MVMLRDNPRALRKSSWKFCHAVPVRGPLAAESLRWSSVCTRGSEQRNNTLVSGGGSERPSASTDASTSAAFLRASSRQCKYGTHAYSRTQT